MLNHTARNGIKYAVMYDGIMSVPHRYPLRINIARQVCAVGYWEKMGHKYIMQNMIIPIIEE